MLVILVVIAGCGREKTPTTEIRGDVDAFATRVATLGGKAEVSVDFGHTPFTDEDLAALTFPDTVTQIDLRGTKVTDEGLVHLKKIPQLERLNLSGTRVSDAGMVHLQALSNLCYLDLQNSLVSLPKQVEMGKELIPRQNAHIARKAAAAAKEGAPLRP